MQEGRKGRSFIGTAKKRSGEIQRFKIAYNWNSTRKDTDQYITPRITLNNNKSIDRIDLEWSGDIAIITINDFLEDMPVYIDSVMTLTNNNTLTKGLIIDLRDNRGGSSDVATHLQMYLDKSDNLLSFGWQTRINNGYGRSQGNYRPEYSDFYLYNAYQTNAPTAIPRTTQITPLKYPVILLIGKNSYSACEDLLVNIYELDDRPLLIGEESGGSTGAPLVVNLPDGSIARICTLRALYPISMQTFVNKGITPDITIKQTFEDYCNRYDPALQKAIEILAE